MINDNVPYQLTLPISLAPSYSEQDLYPADCQQMALKWIDSWPNQQAPFAIICGEKGSGKTHLSHIWQSRAQALFIYPDMVNDWSPLTLVNSRNAFIIDDVDEWLANGIISQDWLFHFYNLVREKKGAILLTARKTPNNWGMTLPDLMSRLNTFVQLLIDYPDDETLKALFTKQLTELGVMPDKDLLNFMVNHIERSFEKAQNVLYQANQKSLQRKQKLNQSLIREILATNSF